MVQCPRSGMLQPWQPFMAFAVLLSIALEGCDESAQTCYPDDSASDTGQYSCVNNKYCSRQNFAEILPDAMSLQECMNECVSRNCQVIQYDCGTHCWLLDSCGDHVESGCGSSVYYRDLNFVEATTTTTTTTTTVSLIGSCFPDTVDSGEYSCSANKLCSQQLAASRVFSSLSLDLCLDQCNQDPTCHSIQHECGSQCWLMNNGATCGTESLSTCGTSIYYKRSYYASTTGVVSPGACFPSTVNTGTYTCVADSYCMNQERATKYTSVTSLSDCLDVCNNLDACTAVQWDCGTECWAMVDDTCGTEIQSLCGSSLYYKVTTTTTTTTTQAATTLAGEDNCWPGVEPNGLFTCHAQKYCSNQLDAKKLGAMTLQACMRECEQYQCGAIQYDCNEECWLLRSCESYVDSSCSSQTYVPVADGWPATTTTTTIFGACFPTSDISYTFTDFTCTPAVYCNTQASASKYGSMTIHQCAEMCRHDSTCSYIQYDCNTDCWLLASCDTYLTSTCGSSIYQKSTSSNSAGSTYLLADGHTSITYSPTSCSEDDCVVTASCPAGSWPTECSTIPPQSGDGAYQGIWATAGGGARAVSFSNTTCEAKGNASLIIAQAICSDLVETHFEGSGLMAEGDLNVTCADGSAVSCNCWTAWTMEEVCGAGRGTFLPTIPDDNSPPRCEQNIVPGVVSHRRRQSGVGGGISAVCAKGKYQDSYFWPSTVEQDTSVQYCGWASQRFAADVSVDNVEADCRGWMSEPASNGGCTTSECTALVDCVRICNNCGACRGILHNSGVETPPIACYMLAAEPLGAVVNISDSVPAPDALLPKVFYVNTRHSQCSRSPGISRVSLFSDKGCTTMVQPTGIQDASGTAISSHWSSPFVMTPSCALTGCSSMDFSFKASFSTTTSVLCAVVHSTEEFSKGWEIRLDSSHTIDQGGSYVRGAGSLLASSSYGTAVAFGGISPNLEKGTQVTFHITIALHCNERSSHPGQCRNNEPGEWQLDVAVAFAKMLALDPHFVTIPYTSTVRRLQHDRKLQTRMEFYIEIRIVVNKPHLAAVAKSLESQFAEMRQQSSIFNSTLISLLSPVDDKYMQADQLSEFVGAETPPSFFELPTTTTTVETSATVATTSTAAPAPAPAAEEEEEYITLIAIFSSCGGMALLCFIWIMCRRRKAHVTHPAPAPSPGPPGAARVSASGPTAVVIGGKAELLYDGDEGMAALSPNAYDSLPEYWNARKDLNPTFEMEYHAAPTDDLKFDDLMYVPHGSMHHFQDLVSKTYRDIVTQDRLCPNGKCDKTRGGCPCVQVGGDPGLPSDFQVKRVIRVEESGMFNRYIEKRDQIKKKRVEGAAACEVPDPPFFTSDWMDKNPKSELCKLDSSVNEVYLWHGTQVRVGLQIAMNDFNLTFAGSGAGTMYGKGLYFTESSTKADEYAKDEPGGHYDGIRALLLCRVCVGKFYYTQDREPTAIDKFTAGESDSTIGDRAKKVNTYREIVVYNEDQVYPEYLVIYERLHGGAKASSPRADLPFQLELPLYWKTVGKNPYQEGFRKHRVVKHEILELFQRLVDGTCSSKPKVKRVRRVEDSALWCRYINFKRNLGQNLLEQDQKIKAPNELDGNPESGHVLTEKILAENRGDHAISVENIQPGLNEMLLWHGTTKTAAETIAEEGFMVGNARHGRRFGTGVYLAEDLKKSLSYCSSSDGTNYVLLCRATCAHIYYTEKDWDSDADKPAKEAGCSTVLANPGKKGPREYILFDESQVYPEYIVELEA